MKTMMLTLFVVFALSAPTFAQHHDLKQRGALAMGFDQDKAVHHFRVTPDGGVIEISVVKRSDEETLTHVRRHLELIAREFKSGDFAKPYAIHAEMPPGVSEMQERKDAIAYRYEETPAGGRVVISTKDDRAKKAIEAFLTYQIREHKTGTDQAIGPGALRLAQR